MSYDPLCGEWGQVTRLQRYSYRFAEQVLNSKLALKDELERVLAAPIEDENQISRPGLNEALHIRFANAGWTRQPEVFAFPEDPGARMDFMKERVGVEVGFGHASFWVWTS